MKQKYCIGELEFKTKKDCEDYTRNIINNLGCCIIQKDNKHFNFFYNLIKNHSEYDIKIGVGIDYFYIIQNPMNKKCYQTMIKRIDKSETDFSWVYCCKFKVQSSYEDLIKSMRTSIKDYVIQYKQKQKKLICNFCKNENEEYQNYHVDHNKLSFLKLVTDFLQITKKKVPSSFDSCKIYYLNIFKDEDEDFKNEWVNYHNENCDLQILCQKCNLTKSKN